MPDSGYNNISNGGKTYTTVPQARARTKKYCTESFIKESGYMKLIYLDFSYVSRINSLF